MRVWHLKIWLENMRAVITEYTVNQKKAIMEKLQKEQ